MGAVVGGPKNNDRFSDESNDYAQSKPIKSMLQWLAPLLNWHNTIPHFSSSM